MPVISVEGWEPFETQKGTKLVLALEDNGIDILHRCGGKAKCTTCRVDVISGNLGPRTEEEKKVNQAKGINDSSRLSCQVRVTEDIEIKSKMTISSTGLDPGPRPDK